MEQNKICPLLTTNTVVDENNTVKIGTQPVFTVLFSSRLILS